MSGASERVNGRASGPVLTSGFLLALAHTAAWFSASFPAPLPASLSASPSSEGESAKGAEDAGAAEDAGTASSAKKGFFDFKSILFWNNGKGDVKLKY